MNGGEGAIWDKLNRVAESGCAFREVHDRALAALDERFERERKERMEMGEKITSTMEKMRTQILVGIGLIMVLTLVIDKVLK